jgi:uncharacterized peroxidase-related enzyme
MTYPISLARCPVLESDLAPANVQAVYADFYRRMSFPAAPNFIKVIGHSPAAVQGTWDLVRNILVMGSIPRYIKEMVFVAISKARNCGYCEAAHIACCRMLGVDQELIASLVNDIESISDRKLRDMIQFGLKCAQDPQSLNEADFNALRAHGLNQSEIVELIAMSGLAVYANIMADATAVEPDEMFEDVGGGEPDSTRLISVV